MAGSGHTSRGHWTFISSPRHELEEFYLGSNGNFVRRRGCRVYQIFSVSVKVRFWPLNLNDSWADEGPRPNEKLTIDFSTVNALRLKQQSAVKGTGWVRLPRRNSGGKRVQTTETTPRRALQMKRLSSACGE